MKKLNVAVAGCRGYSGLELTRTLWKHPQIEKVGLYASAEFEPADSWPELQPGQYKGLPLTQLLESPKDFDLVFLALPHEASMNAAPVLLKAGVSVIDLSGAFRLQDGDSAQQYQQWYKMSHTQLELLPRAHYGLLPFQKKTPSTGAALIANPGCYATAISLALIPLLQTQIIDPSFVAIDAKSGTTGAGKKAEEKLLFSEVSDNCLPYRVNVHQHQPEIQMALLRWGGSTVEMSFTPHLLPTRRGIIASIYAKTKAGVTAAQVEQAFASAFEGYPLVRVVSLDTPGAERELRLSRVVGSPRTHIAFKLSENRLTVFSLIDNLLKGAATQAIENMNVLNGWNVALGLNNKEGLL